VIEPYSIVLHGFPRAWSPGFEAPFEAPLVYLDARNDADLEKYKGTLKDAVVLVGAVRQPEARFQPLADRISDEELAIMASALQQNARPGEARAQTAADRRAQFAGASRTGEALVNRGQRGDATSQQSTTQPATRPARRRGFDPFLARATTFLASEGARVIVSPSSQGDGGAVFVSSATIPNDPGPSSAPSFGPSTRPRVWATDVPKFPAQITLAVEDYDRLVHMIQRDQKLKVALDMQVQFHEQDLMAYNTVAEIPGTDLKDQIVMVGAHLDSWHTGTGATDNGAGSAAAMEAVRIIKAAGLQPRRTIRIALWTGEEQGLYGSEAYVEKHFGRYSDSRSATRASSGPTTDEAPRRFTGRRRLIKEADYENLSVYFNLDNGTGKIRGVYCQGNQQAAPIFKSWLAPFADLGATTVTMSGTSGTDHVSFDTVGLPGFQFIQDPIEYWTRTHHSNIDVYERIQAEDMKQASTILAAFVYKAAMIDERFPRKTPASQPASRGSEDER
jgi:hypothetical protein